jgi:hypothetical protein
MMIGNAPRLLVDLTLGDPSVIGLFIGLVHQKSDYRSRKTPAAKASFNFSIT